MIVLMAACTPQVATNHVPCYPLLGFHPYPAAASKDGGVPDDHRVKAHSGLQHQVKLAARIGPRQVVPVGPTKSNASVGCAACLPATGCAGLQ
jgi:hypothetical protein